MTYIQVDLTFFPEVAYYKTVQLLVKVVTYCRNCYPVSFKNALVERVKNRGSGKKKDHWMDWAEAKYGVSNKQFFEKIAIN